MKRLGKKKEQVQKYKPINLFIRFDKRRNTAINEGIDTKIDGNKLTNYQLDLDNIADIGDLVYTYPYFLYEGRLLKNVMYKKEVRLIICDVETIEYGENTLNKPKSAKIIDLDEYNKVPSQEEEWREKINNTEIKEINHEITI